MQALLLQVFTFGSQVAFQVPLSLLETLTVQTIESIADGVSETPFQNINLCFTKLSLSSAQWKCFFYLGEQPCHPGRVPTNKT
ncbi:hypothetical protein I79_012716 [Cricetulus griseus]|uniref:Secreted protein n=1 Tax=Cricetulus griseus TaxID=10029 RepID=G3HPK2_CRIGR|nr:hypothetical protein I79_012716 [Cricetulus griseus]